MKCDSNLSDTDFFLDSFTFLYNFLYRIKMQNHTQTKTFIIEIVIENLFREFSIINYISRVTQTHSMPIILFSILNLYYWKIKEGRYEEIEI